LQHSSFHNQLERLLSKSPVQSQPFLISLFSFFASLTSFTHGLHLFGAKSNSFFTSCSSTYFIHAIERRIIKLVLRDDSSDDSTVNKSGEFHDAGLMCVSTYKPSVFTSHGGLEAFQWQIDCSIMLTSAVFHFQFSLLTR